MITKAIIAKDPQFATILAQYRQQFIASGGKVNEKKFFEEYIHPLKPDYRMRNWYNFINKFKKQTGMVAALAVEAASIGPVLTEEKKLETVMMSNETATALGIRAALNIGAKALESIVNDPSILLTMTVKERADFLFKAMKSQDSRIHAIGKLKEDGREEAKFNKTFGSGAM
jgi:hypothetical protein